MAFTVTWQIAFPLSPNPMACFVKGGDPISRGFDVSSSQASTLLSVEAPTCSPTHMNMNTHSLTHMLVPYAYVKPDTRLHLVGEAGREPENLIE